MKNNINDCHRDTLGISHKISHSFIRRSSEGHFVHVLRTNKKKNRATLTLRETEHSVFPHSLSIHLPFPSHPSLNGGGQDHHEGFWEGGERRVSSGPVSGGGGGSGGAGDRRPITSGDDFPGMVSGIGIMRGPNLPEHVLHVQDSATHHLGHSHANRGSSHRKVHGRDASHQRVQLSRVALHLEPWTLQHEGACHHHNLRKLWCVLWRGWCLLHWCHYCHEGLL